MRYGVCVGLPDQIAALARAGFDFCELPAQAVMPFVNDTAAEPIIRQFEEAALRPESFNVLVPPALPLVGPNVDQAALRQYLSRAFKRMVRLGAPVVVLGSGGARRIPADLPRYWALKQLAESLALVLEEANRAGIEVALEHLNRQECNVFNSIAESQEFIADHKLDGMRLLVDLHHIEMEHEPLEDVLAAAPLIAHVHVADGNRQPPGGGGYNYAGFMQALCQAGYDRRISAECLWTDLPAQAPAALAFMRQSWQATQN
jgi:D-psicose/D-tagatose/L-ribulose 3-epimerase